MLHDKVRKTFVEDKKLEQKVLNLESALVKKTHHHWSESFVINCLIQFAFQKGADATTIARIFDKKCG